MLVLQQAAAFFAHLAADLPAWRDKRFNQDLSTGNSKRQTPRCIQWRGYDVATRLSSRSCILQTPSLPPDRIPYHYFTHGGNDYRAPREATRRLKTCHKSAHDLRAPEYTRTPSNRSEILRCPSESRQRIRIDTPDRARQSAADNRCSPPLRHCLPHGPVLSLADRCISIQW